MDKGSRALGWAGLAALKSVFFFLVIFLPFLNSSGMPCAIFATVHTTVRMSCM